MNRQEKIEEVERLTEALKGGPPAILVNQHGLTVNEVSSLRSQIRATFSKYKVIKNRLALRALKETPLAGLAAYMKGPTAIAYSEAEPAPLAKVIDQFAKENKGLQVKGGFVDGRVIGPDEVKMLADLPPRPILVSRFLAVLNAPMSRLLSVLNAPVRDLARVMDEIARKKGADGPPPAKAPTES
jgi:large subunit ribosomal protein L10